MSKLPIRQPRVEYKPFDYEHYFLEGWMPQAQAFWLHTEIPMQSDVKDWNENLTPAEKTLAGNILLGFAQTECAVGDYWTGHVTRWFPKYEIAHMAMMFGMQETIHATAYSYLNETLGLTDFKAFLQDEATMARFENLAEPTDDSDLGVAKSLAVFSAFAEGVQLYSAFAVLYHFKLKGKLNGISQQMKWSIRDESLHSKMGCRLFRDMCAENPQLLHLCREHIIQAAELAVKLECDYIDQMFEGGDVEGISAYDLKHFIKKRANEKLFELGYADLGSYFPYNEAAADNLEWFYHLAGGVAKDDFFATRVTEYGKEDEDEDWDI